MAEESGDIDGAIAPKRRFVEEVDVVPALTVEGLYRSKGEQDKVRGIVEELLQQAGTGGTLSFDDGIGQAHGDPRGSHEEIIRCFERSALSP